MTTTVTLIEGDGIGPEIAAATVHAVEACGGKLAWERADAGAGAVEKHSDPLPQATIDSIKKNQLALKGPLATPSGGGYRSRQRHAAPAVRSVRERAAGQDDSRRAVAATPTSTS